MDKVKENTKNESISVKKKCFVITPVGAEGSEIRIEANGIIRGVLEPLLKDTYDVKAAHLSTNSVQITKEIIQDIHAADLIIANLTGSNPNVMYELSLAHALRKPVIHIIREGEVPPFDISVHRYISYKNNMLGAVHLSENLSEFIDQVISVGENISNPITDAIDNITVESINRSLSYEAGFENISMRLDQIEKRLKRIRYEPSIYSNFIKKTLTPFDDEELDFQYKRTIDFLAENDISIETFIRNQANIEMLSDVLGIDVISTKFILNKITSDKKSNINNLL